MGRHSAGWPAAPAGLLQQRKARLSFWGKSRLQQTAAACMHVELVTSVVRQHTHTAQHGNSPRDSPGLRRSVLPAPQAPHPATPGQKGRPTAGLLGWAACWPAQSAAASCSPPLAGLPAAALYSSVLPRFQQLLGGQALTDPVGLLLLLLLVLSAACCGCWGCAVQGWVCCAQTVQVYACCCVVHCRQATGPCSYAEDHSLPQITIYPNSTRTAMQDAITPKQLFMIPGRLWRAGKA